MLLGKLSPRDKYTIGLYLIAVTLFYFYLVVAPVNFEYMNHTFSREVVLAQGESLYGFNYSQFDGDFELTSEIYEQDKALLEEKMALYLTPVLCIGGIAVFFILMGVYAILKEPKHLRKQL